MQLSRLSQSAAFCFNERMKKQSAGLLLFRRTDTSVEVLLGHPGGPFWKKKDAGAWSVPKGEYEPDEDPLAAACREFQEETGQAVPDGKRIDLGSMKRKDGKTIQVWGIEGQIDEQHIMSNTFEIEWPPKTGQIQSFPEIDRAGWFALAVAPAKMHQGQSIFIERLAEHLDLELAAIPASQPEAAVPQQTTLL
jgi:predicted NUDIX family NTP pyrophosphohydrolase